MRIWDLSSSNCDQTLQGHSSNVTSVCVTIDCSKIVSGSDDNTVRIWDLSSGNCEHILLGHTSSVTSVCVTADGSKIVSRTSDKPTCMGYIKWKM